jgi:hypothetical protein
VALPTQRRAILAAANARHIDSQSQKVSRKFAEVVQSYELATHVKLKFFVLCGSPTRSKVRTPGTCTAFTMVAVAGLGRQFDARGEDNNLRA